ncbi:hypothetical protein [Bacillus altitudinis]|uniref:hypothetical protein n=1 Tax=Bacillus altitudinis TaxID=293387 RepID=UPI0020D08E0E|nr:hypothetical protein [Bacillus altitudinis]
MIVIFTNCNITIEKITLVSKFKYAIQGRAAHNGSDNKFKLEYNGTELNQVNGFIPNSVLMLLKEDLNEHLGYVPFQKNNQISSGLENVSLYFSLEGKKASRKK